MNRTEAREDLVATLIDEIVNRKEWPCDSLIQQGPERIMLKWQGHRFDVLIQ
jgi:hypothetical protein